VWLYEIKCWTQFFEECFRGPKEIPFGLEEVAARILFEAKRPKFLMSERE
jgi:hypothetical protein